MENEISKNDVTIRMSADGEICIITIPVKTYANDETNGSALVYGKIREIQAHVMQMVSSIRMKKAQAGLVRLNGVPPDNLKVN